MTQQNAETRLLKLLNRPSPSKSFCFWGFENQGDYYCVWTFGSFGQITFAFKYWFKQRLYQFTFNFMIGFSQPFCLDLINELNLVNWHFLLVLVDIHRVLSYGHRTEVYNCCATCFYSPIMLFDSFPPLGVKVQFNFFANKNLRSWLNATCEVKTLKVATCNVSAISHFCAKLCQ